MKYHLMHVSSLGIYPVLTGASPTDDLELLKSLDEIYRKLRLGYGTHYRTMICEIGEDGMIVGESVKRIEEVLAGLL